MNTVSPGAICSVGLIAGRKLFIYSSAVQSGAEGCI